MQAGLGFIFSLNSQQYLSLCDLHFLRVNRGIVEARECLVAFCVPVPGVVVPGCVGQEEHACTRHNGEDALKRNGDTPRVLGLGLGEAVVDPVRNGHTGYQHDSVEGVGRTSVTDFHACLAQVGWHRAGDAPYREAGDDTSDGELGDRVGGRLDDGADDRGDIAKDDSAAAPDLESERRYDRTGDAC